MFNLFYQKLIEQFGYMVVINQSAEGLAKS